MNPIMTLLKKQLSANPSTNSNKSTINQMVNDIKSGKTDAKRTALSFLQNLTPQQKLAIKQMLPKIQTLGKTFGVSESNINSFTKELETQLG